MAVELSTRQVSHTALTCAGTASGSARAEAWWLLSAGLMAIDAIGLVLAFGGAYALRFKAGVPALETPQYSSTFYASVALWSVPIWLVLFVCFRLYDRHLSVAGLQAYVRIANACTAGLLIEVMLSFLEVHLPVSRGWLLLTWLLSILFVSCGRFGARRVLHRLRRQGYFRAAALIVGTNSESRALADQFLADPGSELRLLGFIDAAAPRGTPVVAGLTVLGSLDDLAQVTRHLGVKEIIVASTAVSREHLLDLYRGIAHEPGVELRLSSGLFEILTTGMQVHEINNVPLATPGRVRIIGTDAVLKSSVDYLAAGAALLMLSPVMLVIGLLIWIDSGRPIIHRRRVLGVSGRPFDAFKFRSMMLNAERRQRSQHIPFAERRRQMKSGQDPRVTRVGRVLRRTSLDELPQLVNVLRGEMSLVGPRMIAPDERSRYGEWQHNLLTVKPGITGPWQVRGRGDIPYEERVRLSMDYIRNYSIWRDLDILLRTIAVVLQRKGAY